MGVRGGNKTLPANHSDKHYVAQAEAFCGRIIGWALFVKPMRAASHGLVIDQDAAYQYLRLVPIKGLRYPMDNPYYEPEGVVL